MFPGIHAQLAHIGLPVGSLEEMEAKAIELAPFGEYEPGSNDAHRIVWRDASGAGLSISSDADHVLESILPFFGGVPRARARVYSVIEDDEAPGCDRVIADVHDLRDQPLFRAALLVHDLWSSRVKVVTDRSMELSLTGFVESAEPVARNTMPGVRPHPSVLDGSPLPEPRAEIVCRVLGSETRINRATGTPFMLLKLDANGLPLDAVARAGSIAGQDKAPARGQMLRCNVLFIGGLEPGRNDKTIPRLPGSR